MRLLCPNCPASYEVPEGAIGAAGRKVRCRACGTSWVAMPSAAEPPPVFEAVTMPPPSVAADAIDPAAAFAPVPPFALARSRLRGPLLLGLLVLVVAMLGVVVAGVAWGPARVAGAFGLADRPVPLGIAITRQPDWRMIAGGSELFAVSGRVWNPTKVARPVPDIRAELKDMRGRTVYAWTITRPVASLPAGGSVDFDGAAVDVPRASQRIAVSFARADSR